MSTETINQTHSQKLNTLSEATQQAYKNLEYKALSLHKVNGNPIDQMYEVSSLVSSKSKTVNKKVAKELISSGLAIGVFQGEDTQLYLACLDDIITIQATPVMQVNKYWGGYICETPSQVLWALRHGFKRIKDSSGSIVFGDETTLHVKEQWLCEQFVKEKLWPNKNNLKEVLGNDFPIDVFNTQEQLFTYFDGCINLVFDNLGIVDQEIRDTINKTVRQIETLTKNLESLKKVQAMQLNWVEVNKMVTNAYMAEAKRKLT